ncbi:ESX-1 secretion-associated protein EspD [Mycobacterium basiliense]|uniref:ESX-1 secretion-associated protein EspD n=1 Tax=Mycobacterium basiliense TaxID=2094119 RepID=A0A3S4BDN4_9MYCO|nr:secretion protein EspD [Mycobacterium basiliense]VDM88343.1 ESX-1 secretion-associated protein EspD [Mycobacterium basiliense]
MALPRDDFDRDDFDAVDPWGTDGAPRWAVDPIVGLARPAPTDGETTVDDTQAQVETATVTNPQGSVSVSALMDGRVEQIRLTAQVVRMSESQLAAEILVIADLARQRAQSAQYVFILDRMSQAADGDQQRLACLGEFVRKTWNLPTPAEAATAVAEVFASRYNPDGSLRDTDAAR